MTERSTLDGSESGVTLMELVIVVSILGIVITAIFGVLTSLTATERRAQNRVQAQEDIRLALLEVGRDLRSSAVIDAPADVAAAASNISFTRADGQHRRWILDAANGTLIGEVEGPTAGQWSTFRTIEDVRNGDDNTPFVRYYGAGNQRLDTPGLSTPTDLATCTLRVQLSLKVAPQDVSRPYGVSVDVGLRNSGSRGVPGC